MQSILDAINEWIKEILIGAINGNLSTMFGDVNEKVGTIANEVGQTPQGWNANIFSGACHYLCPMLRANQHGNGKEQYARHRNIHVL